MTPAWQYIRLYSVAGSILASVAGGWAQCPPHYTLDIITPPSCGILIPVSSVSGVSESGEMCGGYGCVGGGNGGLFIWTESKTIPLPGYFESLALGPRDLNSSRQVVGEMFNPDGGGQNRGFHYANGTVTTLLPLSGHNWSEAYRISESGIACGLSSNTWFGGLTAVIWTRGEATPFNLPLGPDSDALAISDSHLVTGWMGLGGTLQSHAYLYNLNTGETTDLGTPLPDTTSAQGTGVNTQGNVCGWSYTDCNPGCTGRRGFIWSNGLVQDLGNLEGYPQCLPQDINDSDIIIGNCSTVTGVPRAFVWDKGVMHRLGNLLIDPPAGAIVLSAYSINNAGQIAANISFLNPSNPTLPIYAGARLNPVPPLTGDITCDWKVNVPDLLEVINAWGACAPPPPQEPFTKNCHADLNGDNSVSLDDLMTVVLHWAP